MVTKLYPRIQIRQKLQQKVYLVILLLLKHCISKNCLLCGFHQIVHITQYIKVCFMDKIYPLIEYDHYPPIYSAHRFIHFTYFKSFSMITNYVTQICPQVDLIPLNSYTSTIYMLKFIPKPFIYFMPFHFVLWLAHQKLLHKCIILRQKQKSRLSD